MTLREEPYRATFPADILRLRHELLRAVREFFFDRGYIEVETANLMRTAPPDPHIDPLAVYVGSDGPFYLHTSPEMGMKKLLASGYERIFQVCKVYREEEREEVHSTEFTMLEWYREGTYRDTISETEALVLHVAARLPGIETSPLQAPFTVHGMATLFEEHVAVDPFGLTRDELFSTLREKGFPGIDEKDDWNSLFFKVFIQEIEPRLGTETPYFIADWPKTISTMAKEKMDEPGRVERFELYMRGLEIANGYTELTDPVLQRSRFVEDNEERRRLNKRTFDIDEKFLEALGALAALNRSCTGVSVGIDRLLMALVRKDGIDDVSPFRFLRW